MEWLQKATGGLRSLTELGLALLGFGVVAQILFGATVPFIQVDVIGSIVDITKQLGSEGLVGLVAVWVLAHVMSKKD
ncbi:hypothetical protein CMI47_14300 [Candidatus Pacearchaeota archaeon]|nr:hypothetical protein [Candidatus Pacearchaeota archaeon]|tara:strand:+ start:1203 stop:1433 length:231 start_codon:yes stop_codon:yes gene_type:complete